MTGPIWSTGDIIAGVVGSFAIFRWATGIYSNVRERRTEHSEAVEDKLTQLTSDFAVHKGEDAVQFKFIKDTLERIERRIEGLQSQMRFVAIEHFKEHKDD